jgi:hypothetical protein
MSFENTSNFSEFSKYLELKRSTSLNYKGVDLLKSLSFELYGALTAVSGLNFHQYFHFVFLRINCSKLSEGFKSGNAVFSTFFKNRQDYSDLVKAIHNSVQNSLVVSLNPHKLSIRINLKIWQKAIRFYFYTSSIKDLSLRCKLYLVIRTIYICNIIDDLERVFQSIDLKGKNYIPFNSAAGIEATITQYFNSKGVNTFHIFHGLFGRYKISIANDIINGENINSRFILAFGEIAKRDLIKDFMRSPSSIYIAGNPKYPIKKISVRKSFKKCIVFNGFGFYDKDFYDLLDLLGKIALSGEISFDIKPHPSSNIDSGRFKSMNIRFLQRSLTLKDLVKGGDYDFAISFNSFTYYECLYYDLICLRYQIGENIDFEGLDDKFFDEESFAKIISRYKSSPNEEINKSIESLLVKALGMGINNYNRIINSTHNLNPIFSSNEY